MQTGQQGTEHVESPIPEPIAEPTGVPRVDAVLEEIAGVGDRPLPEHPEVFDRAHEQLRAALDDTDGADEESTDPSDDSGPADRPA